MAFKWLTYCYSYNKAFINVNFVKEINEEKKLFMSKAYVQLTILIKNSKLFLQRAVASPPPLSNSSVVI